MSRNPGNTRQPRTHLQVRGGTPRARHGGAGEPKQNQNHVLGDTGKGGETDRHGAVCYRRVISNSGQRRKDRVMSEALDVQGVCFLIKPNPRKLP